MRHGTCGEGEARGFYGDRPLGISPHPVAETGRAATHPSRSSAHGEHGRRRPRRDPDLGVHVLDMTPDGLHRDEQLLGHLAVGPAPAISRSTSTRAGEPRRGMLALAGGGRLPAAASTAATATASRRPAPASPSRTRGGVVTRQRRPVRSIGGEGGEHVRRRQDPLTGRQVVGPDGAVVAGAVESLVVGRCRPDECRQRPTARQDPLGVVGVKADPSPLGDGERPGLSQIPFSTAIRPRSWTSPARLQVGTAGVGPSPANRPASPASAATVREWPLIHGDFRSTKSLKASSTASSWSIPTVTTGWGSAASARSHSSPLASSASKAGRSGRTLDHRRVVRPAPPLPHQLGGIRTR